MPPSVSQTPPPNQGLSWPTGIGVHMVQPDTLYFVDHIQSFIESTAELTESLTDSLHTRVQALGLPNVSLSLSFHGAGTGTDDANSATAEILKQAQAGGSGVAAPVATWQAYEGEGVSIAHRQPVTYLTWHAKGDYFASVAPTGCCSCVCCDHVLLTWL